MPGDGRPGDSAPRADFLAGEEPLGIRVDGTALTMTMRTPGDDLELAAGFLVSEAVIRSPADIAEIKLCDGTACGHADHGADHDGMGNIAEVTLATGVELTPGARRNFMTTSACGICGKASIEDICVLPHAPLAADTRGQLDARGQDHIGDVAHPVVAGMAAGGPVAELDLGDVGR